MAWAISLSSRPSASALALASITMRKSRGMTSVKRVSDVSQSANSSSATVEPVYCLGLCANGPAALVDGEPVAHLTADALEAALTEVRQ